MWGESGSWFQPLDRVKQRGPPRMISSNSKIMALGRIVSQISNFGFIFERSKFY